VVTNGSVDAKDQGMVIYCRRLVCQARGCYKGLLMIKKSAVFFPPKPGERLAIKGAVICGDSPMVIQDPPHEEFDAEGKPYLEQRRVEVRGLRLWSTDLIYDPRYLKTVHPLGTFTLTHLQQVE